MLGRKPAKARKSPGAVEVGAIPPAPTTDKSKSRAKLENGDKVVAKRPVEQVEEPISRTRGKEKGQQANESERPSQKQHHRSRETADEDENGQSKAEGERRE